MEQIADDKIMMAIKCCARDGKCNGCNYINKDSCISSLMKDIKDLLAEKDKKIEQLTAERDSLIKTFGECQAEATKALFENDKEIERLKNNISAMAITMHNCAKETEAEAIKECIEKTQAFLAIKCRGVVEDNPNLDEILWGYRREDVDEFLDNLVKEMIGE